MRSELVLQTWLKRQDGLLKLYRGVYIEDRRRSRKRKKYFCGPNPFVSDVLASFRGLERNVDLNNIYFVLI